MLTMALLSVAVSGSPWVGLGAAIAAAGTWVALRRRQASGTKPQTITLTPQHAIHIVELAHGRLVVGTGPGAAPRLLCELSLEPRDLEPQRPVSLLRPSEAYSMYGSGPTGR